MISNYFSKVQIELKNQAPIIKSLSIDYNVLSPVMGIIKGKIIFVDKSILDFRELISDTNHDYRFQWMKSDKTLICRWDSAPHHPKLTTFPHHKHLSDGKISESEEKYFLQLLSELKIKVISNLVNNKRD